MPGQDIQKLLSPCLSKTHKHSFFWSSLGFDYRNSLKEEAIVTVDALNKVTKSADDPNWNTDSVFFSWRRNIKQSCTGKLVWPVARTSHYYQMCLVFFWYEYFFPLLFVNQTTVCLPAIRYTLCEWLHRKDRRDTLPGLGWAECIIEQTSVHLWRHVLAVSFFSCHCSHWLLSWNTTEVPLSFKAFRLKIPQVSTC